MKTKFFLFAFLSSFSLSAQVYENTCTVSGVLVESGYLMGAWNDEAWYPTKSFEANSKLYKYVSTVRCFDGSGNILSCNDSRVIKYQNTYDIYSNYSVSCPLSLSNYDNDPQGCSDSGGYFYSAGTEQVGGTSYGASFFGGSGIVIGGDLKSVTKCGTLGDVVGQILNTAIQMIPLASRMFGSSGLKKMANLAVLDKLQSLPSSSNPPKDFSDMYVGMPRLPSPSGGEPVVPITESPVPPSTNSSGVTGPSRAPNITPDPNYSSIPDIFVPSKTSGDPVFDYSIVDRFNVVSEVSTAPLLSDIVPNVGSSSLPVKETFDFSKMVSTSPEPSTIATVPTVVTRSQSYSGSDPVDNYVVTKTYPDSSSSVQTVKINTTTKTATLDYVTLSPTGETSTVSTSFSVPSYISPSSSSSSIPSVPVTNSSTPSGSSSSNPSTTSPDTVNGQDSSSIINAVMPSYSFPELVDFVPYDLAPVNELMTGTSELFDNIHTQLTAIETTFESTQALINGSWTPPVFPAGSCGDSLVLNWHGRNIDLCPPIVETTSHFSPIVASIVTLGGMALSITIFIGGF